MQFRAAAIASVVLAAACGSGAARRPLPPSAPMPPGPGWIGHWSTRLGTVDLIATSDLPTTLTPQQVAQYPFAGSYELRRGDAAPVTGTLSCNKPTDNHLYCAWDDTGRTGPMIFVMNADGNSFVANWGSPEGTTQFEGRREQ